MANEMEEEKGRARPAAKKTSRLVRGNADIVYLLVEVSIAELDRNIADMLRTKAKLEAALRRHRGHAAQAGPDGNDKR
jgi:hypothetical protein